MLELGEVLNKICRHSGEVRLGEGVNNEGLHELVHSAGRNAGELAVGDDGGRGGLRPRPALGEPPRKIGSLPKPNGRHEISSDSAHYVRLTDLM